MLHSFYWGEYVCPPLGTLLALVWSSDKDNGHITVQNLRHT